MEHLNVHTPVSLSAKNKTNLIFTHMKKGLILLITIFITFVGSFAQQKQSTTENKTQPTQSSSKRLKFMGKSMNCSMSAMATHLQTKGYKIEAKLEGSIFMTGTFQGYRNCDFVLREDYNILSFCRVILPGSYDMSWTKLESDYNDIVYRYTQKYGVPQISKSDFTGNPYSDYEKLDFVENDKCNYYCIFFIEGGSIIVSIESSKRVWITYKDDIATDKIKKIQQDEL